MGDMWSLTGPGWEWVAQEGQGEQLGERKVEKLLARQGYAGRMVKRFHIILLRTIESPDITPIDGRPQTLKYVCIEKQ
ncbi:hypothetical protein ACLKA7_008102 [Drosophila subpalustris]